MAIFFVVISLTISLVGAYICYQRISVSTIFRTGFYFFVLLGMSELFSYTPSILMMTGAINNYLDPSQFGYFSSFIQLASRVFFWASMITLLIGLYKYLPQNNN
ncbi:hypothetical protein Nther_0596 [Natranaerobius thermophilus JW/NM-WN-LF]|uniref:Uncharacterized protein n=1 Tax=Natranaerobius thermophilus (strain ATCC BAA-1301 / DSM 18059 / JW/NM-WN-LF) TaxID=457570 RepID=B2A6Q8_NATTJ|nr:hypothetical protein Nther_0596 [Natranaerobius thermophilus JW/NM-WN-LF]